MKTKGIPLNMPCSDPEGCKHFKDAMKAAERIKKLESKYEDTQQLRQKSAKMIITIVRLNEQIRELKQIIMDIEDYATINFDETLLQLIEGLKDGKNRRDILYGKT